MEECCMFADFDERSLTVRAHAISRRSLLGLAAGILTSPFARLQAAAQDANQWPASLADVIAGCAGALQRDFGQGFSYGSAPAISFSIDEAITRQQISEQNRQNLNGALWVYQVNLSSADTPPEMHNLTLAGFPDAAPATAALESYGGGGFPADAVVESGNVLPGDQYADVFGFQLELPDRGLSTLANARFTAGSALVFYNEITAADPATALDLGSFLSRVRRLPGNLMAYGASSGLADQELAATWSPDDLDLWPVMAGPVLFEGATSVSTAYLRWEGSDQLFAFEHVEMDHDTREESFGPAGTGLNGNASIPGSDNLGYLHNTAIFASTDDAAAFEAELVALGPAAANHHATALADEEPAEGTAAFYTLTVAEDQAFGGYDLRLQRGPFLLRFTFSDFAGVDPASEIDPAAPPWSRLKTGAAEVATTILQAPAGQQIIVPVPEAWRA
jgi:hypothetical protein